MRRSIHTNKPLAEAASPESSEADYVEIETASEEEAEESVDLHTTSDEDDSSSTAEAADETEGDLNSLETQNPDLHHDYSMPALQPGTPVVGLATCEHCHRRTSVRGVFFLG
jgi:hypothetical protein